MRATPRGSSSSSALGSSSYSASSAQAAAAARHPEGIVVGQRAGELLVLREIGADEARDVIDVAAHLPALNHLLDRGQPLLEAAAIGLFLQDDLGKDVD